MSLTANRPAPIRTNQSNAFGHRSMKVRVPKIIEEVQALNPDYSERIQQALETLKRSIEQDAPIPMIDLPAPDFEEWAAEYALHSGATWLDSEWFFAEIFFYRHLMQAVRWWETGRDPFTVKKIEEQQNKALWAFLDLALAEQQTEDPAELLGKLIQYSLWGNRIDLSYAVALAHGSSWTSEDLVADDTVAVVEHLRSNRGVVHIIADNAGTELIADLVLVDTLITHHAERVIYHVKMHPTFVSDTTVPDVHTYLDLLDKRGGLYQALSRRLQLALIDGQLQLAPDLYWNSTRWLWDLPVRLSDLFNTAALVILKGDANYRRATGDALWTPETPFSAVVDYFPAPLLALRTLKSDTICGLPAGLASKLDTIDQDWRINGRRGLIQFSR